MSAPRPIDTSRDYLPPPLTPLFHTPSYDTLDGAQRRRYNQLHAVYVNEQILFFEVALADNVLSALLRLVPPAGLAADLRKFRDDEAAHATMFRDLNRRCAPQIYEAADFHFVRIGTGAGRLLGLVSRRPATFPLFVWLMLMLEERALYYAREMVRQRRALEPTAVATHARHLRDEVHHVRWDQAILDWLWPRTSPTRRRLNALVFRWMVGEFFNAPKRAALLVLDALVAEFPELAPRRGRMAAELRALGTQPDYHRFLYARHIVPRTFERFDRWQEFASLGRVLLAYRPGAA